MPDNIIPAQPGTRAVVIHCRTDLADPPTMADVVVDDAPVIAWRIPEDSSDAVPVLPFGQYSGMPGNAERDLFAVDPENVAMRRGDTYARISLLDAKAVVLARARSPFVKKMRERQSRAAAASVAARAAGLDRDETGNVGAASAAAVAA